MYEPAHCAVFSNIVRSCLLSDASNPSSPVKWDSKFYIHTATELYRVWGSDTGGYEAYYLLG
jgi:hypothetical protein